VIPRRTKETGRCNFLFNASAFRFSTGRSSEALSLALASDGGSVKSRGSHERDTQRTKTD
jgi:hypothetical protein